MRKPVYARPFATVYYTDSGAPDLQHTRRSACKTLDGAKRATATRLVLDEYTKAHIVDRRFGYVVLTLRRTRVGITLHYGRSGD